MTDPADLKILLITYHFMPEMNAGSDRPNSLFKYAAENGVKIDVVTSTLGMDTVETNAVRRIETISGWNKPAQLLRKFPCKFGTKLIEPFFLNVDFYWLRNVLRTLLNEPGTYNAVYAVYPEPVALLAAEQLSRRLAVPLITDFTDSIGCDPLFPMNRIQKITQLRWERRVVRHSAANLTIAEGFETYLRAKYPGGTFRTVYNGYDPDDFPGISAPSAFSPRPGAIRVFHFGNISASRKRSIGPLAEGLQLFRARSKYAGRELELCFVGRFTTKEMSQLSEALPERIRFLPHMAKREGLKMLAANADYLLLYGTPNQPSTVTSKLFEYLRLGKPILGICGGNEAQRIIAAAGAGETAEFIPESVCGLFQRAVVGEIRYCPVSSYIEGFSRRSQAKAIFDFIRPIICRPN